MTELVKLQMRVAQLEVVVEAADEHYKRMQEKLTRSEREVEILTTRVSALEDQLKTLGAEVPLGEVQVH